MIEREDILPIDSDTLDTITLDMSSLPPYLTANSNSIIGPYPSLNVGVGSASGSLPYLTYTTNGNSGSTSPWQNLTMTNNHQSSMQVQGDAVFEGKVMINGQDLGEFMETISKRLSILVPDPAKLEHFEALKKAYNHYKTLEALCELPKEEKE